MSSEGLSYAAAGVDIEAYERALERVKPLIAATHGKEVAVGVGPFAGLYALAGGGHLAASADGVGTKRPREGGGATATGSNSLTRSAAASRWGAPSGASFKYCL